MLRIAEYLRSLGFGSLAGGGLAALLFWNFPQLFPAGTTLENVILVGSILGTVTHRLIDVLIAKSLLHPLIKFTVYYRKLVELYLLRTVIDERTRVTIVDELTIEHFLGERSGRPDEPLYRPLRPYPSKAEDESFNKEDLSIKKPLESRAQINKILEDTAGLEDLRRKLEMQLEHPSETKDENAGS